MESVIQSATQAAHSLAATILPHSHIQPGATFPQEDVKLDSGDAEKPTRLELKGRNIILGVPGAFTMTCSKQIPQYIEMYDHFKAKGIDHIYVVCVNDLFVTRAWKKTMALNGTPITFIADDQGALTSALGMVLDASTLLGSPRSKRYAIVTEGDKVKSVAVEQQANDLTVTGPEAVLASLSK